MGAGSLSRRQADRLTTANTSVAKTAIARPTRPRNIDVRCRSNHGARASSNPVQKIAGTNATIAMPARLSGNGIDAGAAIVPLRVNFVSAFIARPVQRSAGLTIGRLFFAERARELIDEWFYEK